MPHIGRVFGNKVMEIRFRTPCTEPLQVGEMLVVEEDGSETDDRYLIRTMDIEHGADSETPDWMQREAGGMLLRDASEQRVEIGTLKDRLYKVGVSTPLGCITGASSGRRSRYRCTSRPSAGPR